MESTLAHVWNYFCARTAELDSKAYLGSFLIILSRTIRLATLPPCCMATAPTRAYTAPDMMTAKPDP